MTNSTKTIIGMAAGMVLSGMAFAQDSSDVAGKAADQQQGKVGVSTDVQSGSGRITTDRDAGASGRVDMDRTGGGMSMQQGQQVDQQIIRQIMQASQDQQNGSDKMFVLGAAVHNNTELAIAKLAQQKAQSPEVKQVAQQLVQDHTQAAQQLTQVAQQLNLDLPQGIPSLNAAKIQAMSSLQGDKFDKKFLAHMHAAHAHDVAAFQSAATMAQNPQVKQFATTMLPKLAQHHQTVAQVALAQGVISNDVIRAGMIPGHEDMPKSQKGGVDYRDNKSTTPRSSGGSSGGSSGETGASGNVGGAGDSSQSGGSARQGDSSQDSGRQQRPRNNE